MIYSILRHSNTFHKLANLQLNDLKSKKKEEEKKSDSNETPNTMEKMEEINQANSFQPTKEWLESWRQQLPMNIPLKLIESLEPKIQSLVTGR